MDSGTGIRELGRSLLAAGEPVKATMLLSHSHWDHIQGFPFFAPLLFEGNEFTILGPQEHSERLNGILAGQMQYRYFPLTLDQLAADIRYQELREEALQIGSTMVSTHYLNHTSMALAYKLTAGGRTIVYATDNEPFTQQPRAWDSADSRKFMHKGDEALASFIRGADILILDSQYTMHEYPKRIGWGHGTPDYALDIAIASGVGTLVLFHHEPTRIDTALSVVEQLAQKRAAEEAPDLEVIAAAEGMTLDLDEIHAGELSAPERRLPEFHSKVRIAIVGARDDFMRISWKALAQDHYEVVAVNDLGSFESAKQANFQPHLVLLEYGLEGWDPHAREIMQRESKHHVPVICSIPAGNFEYAQDAFDQGAADVIIEPFAPVQLRSRVDSWLMRTGIAVDRRVRGRQTDGHAQTVATGR